MTKPSLRVKQMSPKYSGAYGHGLLSIILNHIFSHCIQNWPVTREISNSLKFCRVEPARWWHVLFLPLLRIAGFLPASWPVRSGRDFKVSPLPPPMVAVDGRRIPPWQSRFPPKLSSSCRVNSCAVGILYKLYKHKKWTLKTC